jgi:hypothetical protein
MKWLPQWMKKLIPEFIDVRPPNWRRSTWGELIGDWAVIILFLIITGYLLWMLFAWVGT